MFLKKLWITRKIISLSLHVGILNFKVGFMEMYIDVSQKCMHLHGPTSRCKIFK